MSHNDPAWFEERIAKKKALIVALEDAISIVAATGQSYSVDTGQTRQTVTRANLTSMRDLLAAFENDLAILNARLCGSGRVVVRPGF